MKSVLILILSLASASSFAATATCKKAATRAAIVDLTKNNGDDCSLDFVIEGKKDPNIVNVGVSCDHTESYLYQVLTAPQGHSCRIVSIKSKIR